MEYQLPTEVLVERDGPVRIMTLNRPEQLNSVSDALHRGVQDALTQIGDDEDARAIVLTGAGRAFCSGGDISTFPRTSSNLDYRRWQLRNSRSLVDSLLRCHLPIVAAVNGPAIGLGCSMAVLCDIVIMADNAFFADPHVSVGLVAGDGGAAAWPMMMSILKAKEYIFLGDRIPAVDAERLGLANRVVPRDTLRDESLALAHRLAGQPRQALQETKRAINIHLQRAMLGVLEFALATESESFATDDLKERVQQFIDKA
jgi:enoyl-CoA hydratase